MMRGNERMESKEELIETILKIDDEQLIRYLIAFIHAIKKDK